MRTFREILKTTLALIRGHWGWMILPALFIAIGVRLILTGGPIPMRGGVAATRFEGDSLLVGGFAIAFGGGMILLKWTLLHLGRRDRGEF